jgi:hypothetical protein
MTKLNFSAIELVSPNPSIRISLFQNFLPQQQATIFNLRVNKALAVASFIDVSLHFHNIQLAFALQRIDRFEDSYFIINAQIEIG